MATTNTKERLLILWDGNNLFRRCAGNKGLAKLTFKGQKTGAIHGTVKSVLESIQQHKPDECLVVFDGHGARSSKQKLYAGYKAQRSTMDDDLHRQMLLTIEILKAAGIAVYRRDGVDGDDALAIVRRLKGRRVLIESNDKDILQLVNKRIKVIRHRGNGPELWDSRRVRAEFGVPPKLMADYLAMCGDSIDNIPGLKNCGPKNAVLLLKEFGSLQSIVVNRDRLPGKWREAVNKQRKELQTFYRLTRLNAKVVSESDLNTISKQLKPAPYQKTLMPLLEQHGLTWLQRWFVSHKKCVTQTSRGLWG